MSFITSCCTCVKITPYAARKEVYLCFQYFIITTPPNLITIVRMLFLIFIFCDSTYGYGQESSKIIEDSIKTLEAKMLEYQKALAAIPGQILALEERLPVVRQKENIADLNEKIGIGITVTLSEKSEMRTSYGTGNGSVLHEIPKGKSVVILNAEHYPYYKVRYKNDTGYIPGWSLNLINTTIEAAHNKAALGVITSPPTTSNYTPSSFPSSTYTPSTDNKTNCIAVQCSGTTQKGTRCKNMTTNCNGRCHYH